jgi:hypothetical protein
MAVKINAWLTQLIGPDHLLPPGTADGGLEYSPAPGPKNISPPSTATTRIVRPWAMHSSSDAACEPMLLLILLEAGRF